MPKNNSKKSAVAQYAKKMRALRPFVNFDVDLRKKEIAKSDKAKITKYFNELTRMTQGKPYAVKILKPRKKKRLKSAQYMAGQRTDMPGFKVAFIPVTSDRQKIKFNKKDEIIIESPHVSSTFIAFDAEKLAIDPLEYVREKLANRKENVFAIQAGDIYEMKNTASKKQTPNQVYELCQKYGDETANNYFGNWLFGVNAYRFKNQVSLDSYRNTKRENSIKRERAKVIKNRPKLYYWFIPPNQVSITMVDEAPSANARAISKAEYDKFIKGKISGDLL